MIVFKESGMENRRSKPVKWVSYAVSRGCQVVPVKLSHTWSPEWEQGSEPKLFFWPYHMDQTCLWSQHRATGCFPSRAWEHLAGCMDWSSGHWCVSARQLAPHLSYHFLRQTLIFWVKRSQLKIHSFSTPPPQTKKKRSVLWSAVCKEQPMHKLSNLLPIKVLSCSLFFSHREMRGVQEIHFQVISPHSMGRKPHVSHHPGAHQKTAQDLAFQVKYRFALSMRMKKASNKAN